MHADNTFPLLRFLPEVLLPLCYSTHTNTAALALSTTTNITMATNQATNGVSSSSHMTELTDQVIETLLVSDFSDEVNSVGLQCLLRALVKLSSVSSSASKSAIDTVISLLPQFTGEWSDSRGPDVHVMTMITYCTGQSLRLLSDALIVIAANTGDMWRDVATTLTDSLTHHSEQLLQLLVRMHLPLD